MCLLSIVITTRDRWNTISDCIDSIIDSAYGCDAEIIVVEDNPDMKFFKYLEKKFFDKIIIIHIGKKISMIQARNVGANSSKGKYVLFIDDDNVIDKEMISNLIDCAMENPSAGIVGPLSMYYDNIDVIWFAGQAVNLWTGKTKFLGHNTKLSEFKIEILHSDGIPNSFMVKKEVFDAIGYFDERLWQDWTEVDFSFIAKKYGYETLICPLAITYHRVPLEKELLRTIKGGGYRHKAYFLTRNRFIIIKNYSTFFQKIVFAIIFSWIYPLLYSIIALRYKQFDILCLYFLGFRDGFAFFLTNYLKDPAYIYETNDNDLTAGLL